MRALPIRNIRAHPPRTWRSAGRRLGVLAALTGLLSTLVVVAVAPNPAHAAYGCDNVPQGDGHDYYVGWDADEDKFGTFLVVFWLKSWERTFNVAGSATDGNDSDSPQNKTFVINESQTFTVSETNRVSGSSQVSFLRTALSTSYERSTQLTQSHTTSSQITYQETLAPHVAKKVYNGVDAINVRFDIEQWLVDDGRCWWRPGLAAHDVFKNVPTTNERRDVKQLPTINPGGVVDGVTYDRNIRPCEVVAIFGNAFEAPNRVVLRQGSRTWYVGAGTPWFYESWLQINAMIPCDVSPNDYVSVSVESNKNIERLETLWPRSIWISP
jgi:hypothetical protein